MHRVCQIIGQLGDEQQFRQRAAVHGVRLADRALSTGGFIEMGCAENEEGGVMICYGIPPRQLVKIFGYTSAGEACSIWHEDMGKPDGWDVGLCRSLFTSMSGEVLVSDVYARTHEHRHQGNQLFLRSKGVNTASLIYAHNGKRVFP